ncbi:MAG: tetratricopeptide repeat protein [Gammaproteobacteria bacterium]
MQRMQGALCVAALAALLLAGCAATPPGPGSEPRSEAPSPVDPRPFFGDEAIPPLPDAEMLGLDAPMRAFLAANVSPGSGPPQRLHQLLQALLSPSSFGLQYTTDTRSAADTFRGRNGNCLSFTALFVAMARELGLKARFQEVAILPDWEQRGDTLVLNRHVNARVWLGSAGQQSVDFASRGEAGGGLRERVISDQRAAAHFHSNLAVEKLQAGDARAAFLHMAKGLREDPAFVPLWVNLGALYSRHGHPQQAERAWLEAVRRDPGEVAAASNLALLYQRLGDAARAASWAERARHHRERNPYFRYALAKQALASGQPDLALAHLDAAIRAEPGEPRFQALRSSVQLQLEGPRGGRG